MTTRTPRLLTLALIAALLAVAPSTAGPSNTGQPLERAAARCGASPGFTARPGLTAHLPGGTNHEAMLYGLIRNARPGSTIRVAMWAFTNRDLARALVRAARTCGVHVQVLVPKNNQTPDGMPANSFPFPATRDLQQALNRDDDPRSYVAVTTHSARGADQVDGTGTTMHQKSWQFSHTGSSRRVTVITSANATNEARTAQTTDAWTWVGGNPNADAVWSSVYRMFDRQRADRVDSTPYEVHQVGTATLSWGPWTRGMADPVAARINALPTTQDMTIRIANASWAGVHGNRIADALVAKVARARRNGHRVGVFVIADMSQAVRARLRRMSPRPGTCPAAGAGYLHSKFMTVKTSDGGRNPSFTTWAGSSNWNAGATTADELDFRVPGRAAYTSYLSYFNSIGNTFAPSGRCAFPPLG